MMSPHHYPPDDIHAKSRQKIDAEIAQLEARIIALKITQNSLSPITRLHREVIQDIFVLASQESRFIQNGKASLLISWVCRSWRELAHQCSALWSSIDFTNTTWIQAALSRTKSRPLSSSLSVPLDYSGDLDFLASLCLGNLPRISKLVISSLSRNEDLDDFTHLSPLWLTPAPQLVELSLYNLSLPSGLFSGTCPALQRLFLGTCKFDWKGLPIHDGIKRLNISSPIDRISAHDLVQQLRMLGPEVEDLSFRDTLLLTVAHPSSSQTRHEFANLKAFIMYEDTSPGATYILNQLSLPLCFGRAIISVGGSPSERLDIAQALTSCRGLAKWPVNSLEVDVQDDCITIAVNEDSQMTVEGQQVPRISLTFDQSKDISDIVPVLDALPLPPIKILSLSSGQFHDLGPTLTDYFDAQGALERLDLCIKFVPTFSGMLYMHIQQLRELVGCRDNGDIKKEDVNDKMKAQCRGILAFHQLTTLRYHGAASDEFPSALIHYSVIREWLMWRQVAGLGLKTLIFEEMVAPPEDYLVTLYEPFVEKFDCVGIQEMTRDWTPFSPES
ncbi:hypothetical protein BDN72DRAFT_946708 [Pluteus cervinus]|uniref:Uncharacterized protein n=1 Tax=Pluteus cervinus TaxID=181527 RepID=A0ACD3A0I0_9AGAR|nr:hypothetical protein BDN72DRAFT_946708 [Pluteus cervinus]